MPGIVKFSGVLPSGGGTTQFHADSGSDEGNAALASSQGYVPPACTVTELHVRPTLNTTANSTTFTVYKNGSATAVTVSVGAGSTSPATDTAHSVAFNGTTDVLDLVSVRSGSLATKMLYSAVLKTTPGP